jgi:adenine-specific DNA-methyltransferase
MKAKQPKPLKLFIRKNDVGLRNPSPLERGRGVAFVVANAKRIEAILDKVKICDPAIGSGAFPMGMLQEIFKAKTTLDLTLDKAQVKKEIIQNSIYGVDIEKGAVDIARLRFWLSLVVDEDVPQPLPNLDYKIMQGNSLLESFEEVDLSTLLKEYEANEPILYANNEQVQLFADAKQTLMVFDKADKQDLQKLINLYFDFEENTKTKYKNKQEIKLAINAIIEGKLKDHFYLQKNKYEAEKTEVEKGIIANAIKPTDPKGIVDKKNKNLALVTKKLDDIEYKINHLTDILHKLHKWENEDKERPYFLWHTYFKDVFDNGGFDIVIGNPPYIKVQSIPKKLIQYLKENFKSATGKFDIYVIFIEYAFRLIKKNGCITFINPHRFLISEYGEGLRKILFDKKAINKAVYFGVEQIFETATTYTGIFLLKENSEKLSYVIPKTRDLSNLRYSVKEYKNSNFNFNFLLDTNSNLIIEKITKNEKVSEIFDGVYQGIIPMGDDIQVLKGEIEGKYFIGYSKGLEKDIKIESDIVKPILKGENIERYMLLKTTNYIFYPHYIDKIGKTKPYEEDFLKTNFPLAYEYILNFKNELVEKKKKYKTNPSYWYSLHRSREGFIFETPKLITPQLQNHPSFTLDNNKFYADAGGYIILHKKGDSITLKTYLISRSSKSHF